MTIDDSYRPNKTSLYTTDILPSALYVASGKPVSNLITPYESPHISVLTSDYPDTNHIIMSDKPGHAMVKIGYFSMQHNGIRFYKKYRLY